VLKVRDELLNQKNLNASYQLMLDAHSKLKGWRREALLVGKALVEADQGTKALKLAEAKNDRYLRAMITANIGRNQLALGDAQAAAKSIEQAFSSIEASDPKGDIVREYLVDTLIQMKLPKEALKYVIEEDFPNQAWWLAKIAASLADLGLSKPALNVFHKAIQEVQKVGQPEVQASILIDMGESFYAMNLAIEPRTMQLFKEILAEK
ncbi:MAG: hypothetical protein DCC75_00095, partial [Proteobacteria bacterium]